MASGYLIKTNEKQKIWVEANCLFARTLHLQITCFQINSLLISIIKVDLLRFKTNFHRTLYFL